jgi:hypothetical protein
MPNETPSTRYILGFTATLLPVSPLLIPAHVSYLLPTLIFNNPSYFILKLFHFIIIKSISDMFCVILAPIYPTLL